MITLTQLPGCSAALVHCVRAYRKRHSQAVLGDPLFLTVAGSASSRHGNVMFCDHCSNDIVLLLFNLSLIGIWATSNVVFIACRRRTSSGCR